MYSIDRRHTERHATRSVFDVSVRDLYVTAMNVCARANPALHGWWWSQGAASSAYRGPRWDAMSMETRCALVARLRAYAADHDDLADEVLHAMKRLEDALVARGAVVLAQGPDTVRCAAWHVRRGDWLDAVPAACFPVYRPCYHAMAAGAWGPPRTTKHGGADKDHDKAALPSSLAGPLPGAPDYIATVTLVSAPRP
jgi:hypothetical protein